MPVIEVRSYMVVVLLSLTYACLVSSVTLCNNWFV